MRPSETLPSTGLRLSYGILSWGVGQVLVFAGSSRARFVVLARRNPLGLAVGLLVLVLLDGVALAIQYGACHLLARWFGARGSFVGVLRPLLLGCIVTWLGGIPVLGLIAAGLWGDCGNDDRV